MQLTHVVTVLFMKLVIISPEGDGSWNHLLQIRDPLRNNPQISFSSKEALPYKEGQSFDAWVDMKCFTSFGVDESITTSWVTFTSQLCDADLLMVEGDKKPRKGIIRPNSEEPDSDKDRTTASVPASGHTDSAARTLSTLATSPNEDGAPKTEPKTEQVNSNKPREK